jgi:uncharacterized protein (TIGR02598 family)
MKRPAINKRVSRDSGFSLVEVVIAMGIAAFCLVAMLGLLPSGLKQVKISSEETAATALLAAVVADLRNTGPGTNATNSPIFQIPIPEAGREASPQPIYIAEDGSPVPTSLDARYCALITLGSSTNASTLTWGNVMIYWPAAARVSNAQGQVETVVGFNRN